MERVGGDTATPAAAARTYSKSRAGNLALSLLKGRRRVTPHLAERDKLDEGSLRSSTLDEGKTSWQDQLDEVAVVHRVCQPPLIDCVSTCTRTMLLG